MRRVARTDRNHQEIIDAFRKMGCSVHSTHQLGGGFPDIVVGILGLSNIVEIKDGTKPPSQRQLTPDEQIFHTEWAGCIDIAENTDDVVRIVKQMRLKAIKIGVIA